MTTGTLTRANEIIAVQSALVRIDAVFQSKPGELLKEGNNFEGRVYLHFDELDSDSYDLLVSAIHECIAHRLADLRAEFDNL